MSSIPCEIISWNRFYALARRLARQVYDSGYRPDTIVAIGRGGYMPARILSDFLGQMDLTSFKIEHYTGHHKGSKAVVRYPLAADLRDRRVLLVDDVSDSGDTFTTAIAHIESRGRPAEIRTAVLHHKIASTYTPDYFAQRLVRWRWLIYPWAVAEDLSSFIREMEHRPSDVNEVAARLAADHGIRRISRAVLQDVLAMMQESIAST